EFYKHVLQKGKEAKEKVSSAFSDITLEQLNSQPSPASWSIAQCLSHLIISHHDYFADLKTMTGGYYKMNIWEKYSPFQEVRKNNERPVAGAGKEKDVCAQKKQPASNASPEIIEQYYKSPGTLLEYISNCLNIDIDKTIITSPIFSIVTHCLRDAFQFLLRMNTGILTRRYGL
ncbi:MAG: DinB family protein, partial [Chitinophagaceae bacterium]